MLLALALGAHAIAFVVGLSIVLPAVLVVSWRHRPVILDQSDYPVPDPDDPEWDRRSVWGFAAEDSDEDER